MNSIPSPPSLTTPRLRLRPMVLEDAAFILELLNEPDWLEFIGDKGVRTLPDARAYLERGPLAMYQRCGFGLLLVEQRKSPVAVGICGLIQREELEGVDLGFAFLRRFQGRGFGFEAAGAVLAHGQHELGFTRFLALTARHNERSIRLLTRLGFRFQGIRPESPALRESRVFVRTTAPDVAPATTP